MRVGDGSGSGSCVAVLGAVNKAPQCVAWGHCGVVLYACDRAVVLYDPAALQSRVALVGHTGRVQCVRWLSSGACGWLASFSSAEHEFVSGGSDGRVCVWRRHAAAEWACVQSFVADALTSATTSASAAAAASASASASADASTAPSGVLSMAHMLLRDGSDLLAVLLLSGAVCVWQRAPADDAAFALVQRIASLRSPALSVALGRTMNEACGAAVDADGVPEVDEAQVTGTRSSALLALGCADGGVRLYGAAEPAAGSVGAVRFDERSSVTLTGHTDWVNDLSFDGSGLLGQRVRLVSASQDSYVRMWTIRSMAAGDTPSATGALQLRQIVLSVAAGEGRGAARFACSLEALLQGHEGWVYTSQWQPVGVLRVGDASRGRWAVQQRDLVLTASADRTMLLWEPVAAVNGVWVSSTRVGEAGGLTLGFWGAALAPDGASMLGYTFNGGVHAWRAVSSSAGDASGESERARSSAVAARWVPLMQPGGHFGAVMDAAWERTSAGAYFVSVSADQTARVFGQWVRDGHAATWHELARSQIHGYDLNCVAMLPGVEHAYASGADEKLVRVLEAPNTFLDSLERIARVPVSSALRAARPIGASVPNLGLTNKAVVEGQTAALVEDDREGISPAYESRAYDAPPAEDALMQNTLWAEVRKLYGHGYAISAVGSMHGGPLVASACESTSVRHASIRFWNSRDWTQVANVEAHKLTVAQIEFSPDDRWMVAVSRDRGVSLFECRASATPGADASAGAGAAASSGDSAGVAFEVRLAAMKPAAHARIVWTCSWHASGTLFATGSRDKTLALWEPVCGAGERGERVDDLRKLREFSFAAGVTAVRFCAEDPTLLAVGLETGDVLVWQCSTRDAHGEWSPLLHVQAPFAHAGVVHRLAWRPREEPGGTSRLLLSVGADHTARLWSIART